MINTAEDVLGNAWDSRRLLRNTDSYMLEQSAETFAEEKMKQYKIQGAALKMNSQLQGVNIQRDYLQSIESQQLNNKSSKYIKCQACQQKDNLIQLLQQRIDQNSRELSNLGKQLQFKEIELERTKKDLRKNYDEVQQLETEMDMVREHLKRVEREMEEKTQQTEELRRKIHQRDGKEQMKETQHYSAPKRLVQSCTVPVSQVKQLEQKLQYTQLCLQNQQILLRHKSSELFELKDKTKQQKQSILKLQQINQEQELRLKDYQNGNCELKKTIQKLEEDLRKMASKQMEVNSNPEDKLREIQTKKYEQRIKEIQEKTKENDILKRQLQKLRRPLSLQGKIKLVTSWFESKDYVQPGVLNMEKSSQMTIKEKIFLINWIEQYTQQVVLEEITRSNH